MNASDFHVLAERVRTDLPDGREKSIVLTKIDEARLWAAEAAKKAVDR